MVTTTTTTMVPSHNNNIIWIPGHCGIDGDGQADTKLAHSSTDALIFSYNDSKRIIENDTLLRRVKWNGMNCAHQAKRN